MGRASRIPQRLGMATLMDFALIQRDAAESALLDAPDADPFFAGCLAMNILSLHGPDGLPEFEAFLHQVSGKLAAAICRKMQTYSEFDDVYSCSSLKILNPRIWGYKGTIYKLRVDCGKESARVLFVKTPANDVVLLHGFVKKTRKTPEKDARIAMQNFQRLKNNGGVISLPLVKYVL
jgi:phage-related protein